MDFAIMKAGKHLLPPIRAEPVVRRRQPKAQLNNDKNKKERTNQNRKENRNYDGKV